METFVVSPAKVPARIGNCAKPVRKLIQASHKLAPYPKMRSADVESMNPIPFHSHCLEFAGNKSRLSYPASQERNLSILGTSCLPK